MENKKAGELKWLPWCLQIIFSTIFSILFIWNYLQSFQSALSFDLAGIIDRWLIYWWILNIGFLVIAILCFLRPFRSTSTIILGVWNLCWFALFVASNFIFTF